VECAFSRAAKSDQLVACGTLISSVTDNSWPDSLGSQIGRCAQPSGFNLRTIEAGFFPSFSGGRMGRCTRLPPQFGQRPCSLVSAQWQQNVHSKLQIIASSEEGGRSLSQHSQFGRSSSIVQRF